MLLGYKDNQTWIFIKLITIVFNIYIILKIVDTNVAPVSERKLQHIENTPYLTKVIECEENVYLYSLISPNLSLSAINSMQTFDLSAQARNLRPKPQRLGGHRQDYWYNLLFVGLWTWLNWLQL